MTLEPSTEKSRPMSYFSTVAQVRDLLGIPEGCYIPVKVTANRSVITGIGSGISVEKTSDQSIDYLEGNTAEISEALKKSMESLNEAQQSLTSLSDAVQQEYAARRQAGANIQ